MADTGKTGETVKRSGSYTPDDGGKPIYVSAGEAFPPSSTRKGAIWKRIAFLDENVIRQIETHGGGLYRVGHSEVAEIVRKPSWKGLELRLQYQVVFGDGRHELIAEKEISDVKFLKGAPEFGPDYKARPFR